MKHVTLVTTALLCACLLTAGIASAQTLKLKQAKMTAPRAQAQTTWAKQSPHPPYPTVRTPVAGYSPNFAAPQPATKETLERDANRLVRWQGWVDVDAFSVSVLNQMQKQLGNAIEVGSFTIDEPAIAEAVAKASADPTFKICPILEEGSAIKFENTPTLYVWTYRHNYTNKGLYQLYVSAKGTMYLGDKLAYVKNEVPVLHNDIQSLYYEFGNLGPDGDIKQVRIPVFADIEVWRGAVVLVNDRGVLTMAGTQPNVDDRSLEVNVVPGGLVPLDVHSPVEVSPLSLWERAPSLICNPNYDPRHATGAAFVEPLERAITIGGNSVQQRAGDVQSRVNTVTPFRYRSR